ncbi:MAG TPA: fumarylacetoacetate hydrolase family protein [Gammaproteobacteria bacterium]|nr:fumarylacetoacetate hydrolase family protein [Gammaproteobacteria bacterium]
MKLVSFRIGGDDRLGLVVGNGIADLSRCSPALSFAEAISPAALAEIGKLRDRLTADYALDEVEYRLPVSATGKVLCIGRNYAKYHEVKQEGRPQWPSVFGRFLSSFVAHGQLIVRPKASEQLDYEGELCAVIGQRGRHLRAEEALEYVAGYTLMNEGSVRDWQRYGSQNCPGKNFWHSGSMGPWMVTCDEIPDVGALTIATRVEGETRQHGSCGAMLFSVAEAISHVSRFTQLEPGDVIATGSPGGSAIDSEPHRWLEPGQTLEVEIDAIGILRNGVVAE